MFKIFKSNNSDFVQVSFADTSLKTDFSISVEIRGYILEKK